MDPEIYLVGGIHNDPLGRDNIAQLLLKLHTEYQFVPDCAAAEWSEEDYKIIASQRSKFRLLTKGTFTALSEKDLNALSCMPAYEADSHTVVYPDLPVVWLVDQRNDAASRDRILTCTEDVFKTLLFWCRNDNLSPHQVTLNEISCEAWKYAKKDVDEAFHDFDRDMLFYKKTCNAIDKGYRKIVSFVGAVHTYTDTEGIYANLLSTSGFNVHTIIAGNTR